MADLIDKRVHLPLIAAPMFLVSGPKLVISCCKHGVIGTFPALNQRSSGEFEQWLGEITEALNAMRADGERPAPFGVNLIVHKSNPRMAQDLALCVKYKVPLIITSLGAVGEVVDTVQSYGGKIFHDVISVRHGQKAADAGVDGVIAVCAGAGGHAGTASPFSLPKELRRIFDGTIVLAGAMNTGADVAAAQLMGADLAYMGTRFIATKESLADDRYKRMIVGAVLKDIVYTKKISGVYANFMAQSLAQAGVDLDAIEGAAGLNLQSEARAWKDVWSAGHGVGGIEDVPHVGDLIADIAREYAEAKSVLWDTDPSNH